MGFGYKGLTVWQKAMDLVENIYKVTQNFPREEQYGLTSQLRRASISIPSNIAEGSRRTGEKDTKHFFVIAFGSASEIETQLELSLRLNYINQSEYYKLITLLEEILKMLNKLSRN